MKQELLDHLKFTGVNDVTIFIAEAKYIYAAVKIV